MSNTFTEKVTVQEAQHISVGAKQHFYEDIHEIKHKLTKKLVNELLKKDIIKHTMTYSPSEGLNLHKLDLYAVKQTSIIQLHGFGKESVLELNNNIFTMQEIEQAIKQTYPERFI